ncbi:hypothetical protein HanRHA438_Chr16g0780601 [Helianthus annuus]|nr:hypothetical protein HanRHA438_Chr16g0780601 [Helianthus annuus]
MIGKLLNVSYEGIIAIISMNHVIWNIYIYIYIYILHKIKNIKTCATTEQCAYLYLMHFCHFHEELLIHMCL